jgi:hypothetical protein
MWIGTNDLGVGSFLTDNSLNDTVIPDYIDCIYNRFDSIYAAGGGYFVLMNTAPLQLSPLYGLPGDGGLATSRYWPTKVKMQDARSKYLENANNLPDIGRGATSPKSPTR